MCPFITTPEQWKTYLSLCREEFDIACRFATGGTVITMNPDTSTNIRYRAFRPMTE
jgi:hypothetical protein